MDLKLSSTLLTGSSPSWWAGEERGTHSRAYGLGEKPGACVHTSNPTKRDIRVTLPPWGTATQEVLSQGASLSGDHPALTPGWREQPGQVQALGRCSWMCTAKSSWRPHRGPMCTKFLTQVPQVWKWASRMGGAPMAGARGISLRAWLSHTACLSPRSPTPSF